MERLDTWRWPVVAPAIHGRFIHKAGNSPCTMRFRDYLERLCVGGEHFALQIQVFKARPALAVGERNRRGLRPGHPGKRLRCSRCQNN